MKKFGEIEYKIDDIEIKQTKNVFKSLSKDEFSIFYATDKINRNLFKKARKSFYAKDKVLQRIYDNLNNKNDLYDNEVASPIYMPFVE